MSARTCTLCGATTWLYGSGIRACGSCDLMVPTVPIVVVGETLQEVCDGIIAGTVYDWETEGDAQ